MRLLCPAQWLLLQSGDYTSYPETAPGSQRYLCNSDIRQLFLEFGACEPKVHLPQLEVRIQPQERQQRVLSVGIGFR